MTVIDDVEVSRVVYHDRTNYGKWNGSSYEYLIPAQTTPEDY